MLGAAYKISLDPIPGITITVQPGQTVMASTKAYVGRPPSLKLLTKPGGFNSLLAMTKGIQLRIFEQEGLTKAIASGEGRFTTVAQGPGNIWLSRRKRTVFNPIQRITRIIF